MSSSWILLKLRRLSQHSATLAMNVKIFKSLPHSYPSLELKPVSSPTTDSHAPQKVAVPIAAIVVITQLASNAKLILKNNIMEEVQCNSPGITITEPSVKQFTKMNLFCSTTLT